MLALEFLADKDRVAPRALVDTAVYLHEVILSLEGLQGIALQTAIAKVMGAGRVVHCGALLLGVEKVGWKLQGAVQVCCRDPFPVLSRSC